MSEPRREYSDVPNMIRALRQLDPASPEYRRLHERIIELTLPLAQHTARRFRGRGQSHDDLFQVASVGLVNAVKRFDPDSGSDFLAYAVPTIMGEVRRYFRDCSWAVKVPRRLKDLNVPPWLVKALAFPLLALIILPYLALVPGSHVENEYGPAPRASGIGSLALAGLLDNGLKIRPMVLPDRFIDHASPARQYEMAGLDARGIVAMALSALGQPAERARG